MERWWAPMPVLACISANAVKPIDYPTRPVRVIIPQGPGTEPEWGRTSERIDQAI